MTPPLPIELSRLARQHVRAADSWWRQNRPKAPNAIREELERTSALIASQPNIGSHARDAELEGVRRIHIERIRYFVYYHVVAEPERIEILAFWSSLRGTPPPI